MPHTALLPQSIKNSTSGYQLTLPQDDLNSTLACLQQLLKIKYRENATHPHVRKTLLLVLATLFVPLSSKAEEIIRPSIVGGSNSPLNAYPWMVALVRFDRDSIDEGQFCGGVLIHPKWILTAAHCVDEYDTGAFEVAVNSGNLNGSVDLYQSDGVYIHPEADLLRISRSCDIALIRLVDPITDVEPVQLERAVSALPLGRSVKSLGWGSTDYESGGDTTSSILKEVESVIIEIEGEEDHDPVHDYFIKTEGTDPIRGTYNGDSGGPLLVKNPDDEKWKVAGITSYGRRDVPDNYNDNFSAKISYAAPWIDSYISHPYSQRPEIEPLDRITTGIIQDGEPKVGYRFWPFADGPAVSLKRAGTYPIAGLPSFQLSDGRHLFNEDGSFTFLDSGFSLKGQRTNTSLMQITEESRVSYGNTPIPIVPFQFSTGNSPSSNKLTMGKWGQTFLLENLQEGTSYTYPSPHRLYAVNNGQIQSVNQNWVSGQHPHNYQFKAAPDTLYLVQVNEMIGYSSSFTLGIMPFDAFKLGRDQTVSGTLSSSSHQYRSPFTRAELLEFEGDTSSEFRLELYSEFDAELQLFDKSTAEKTGYYDVASENETETFIFSGEDFRNGSIAVFNFDKDIFGHFSATLYEHEDGPLVFGTEKQFAVTNADESYYDDEDRNTVYFDSFSIRDRVNKDHIKIETYVPYTNLGVAVYDGNETVDFHFGEYFGVIEFETAPNRTYDIYVYDFENYRNANYELTVTDSQGSTLSETTDPLTNSPTKFEKRKRPTVPNSAREPQDIEARFQKALEAYRLKNSR